MLSCVPPFCLSVRLWVPYSHQIRWLCCCWCSVSDRNGWLSGVTDWSFIPFSDPCLDLPIDRQLWSAQWRSWWVWLAEVVWVREDPRCGIGRWWTRHWVQSLECMQVTSWMARWEQRPRHLWSVFDSHSCCRDISGNIWVVLIYTVATDPGKV